MRTRTKGLVTAAAASVLAIGATVAALQQAPGVSRREPQFENDQVKAWKSIIMPNQPLSLHRHDHGRTIVALKGGTLDVVDEHGRSRAKMTWETGKAYWLGPDPPDQLHADMNYGPEPIEVIVVEMKR